MSAWPEILQVLAVALTAGFVAALAMAARDFLLDLRRRHAERMGAALPELAAREPRRGLFDFLRARVLAFVVLLDDRWLNEKRLARIERALGRAGRPLDLKAAEIVALMQIAALLFFAAGAALALLLDLSAACSLACAGVGALYPLIWLRDKIRLRHHAIARALPYSIDLLTLSVEAGLDFCAALAKVVEKGRKGPLADELSVALRELKLGKTREEALRDLAQRVELPILTTFVQALVQADRMGTPIAKVLRILSTQMRVERSQRAEKLANEAPVKLLFPLIACIFPTIFLMLFGPIVYQVFLGGNF